MIDVLIVGAGPVGLSVAIDLLQRGVSCAIIERSSTYAVGTRARGITPRTQEIFSWLGVLPLLREFAEPSLPSRFYDRDNRLVRETPATVAAEVSDDVPFPNALMVSQENTDAVLRRRLGELGGAVELDCAFVGSTQHADRVTAHVLRSGKSERLTARYVIGCDGGGSTVRKCAGIPFTGETWEDATGYLIGNLSVEGIDHEHWYVWTDAEWGYLTLQPITHGDTWLFVATLSAQELAANAEPTAESIHRIVEQRLPSLALSFSNLTWRSTYRRNLRIVDRYRSGRIFLAGDSAHVGVEQGMNVGIEDGVSLSAKLADVLSGAPAALLDTYEEERAPVARQILANTLARDRDNAGNAAAAQLIAKSVSSTTR